MPRVDLPAELRLHQLVLRANGEGLLFSAHDCSDGGLAVTLAESAMLGGLGFEGTTEVSGRLDSALFGEAQGRIVVSIAADVFRQGGGADRLGDMGRELGVPVTLLGETTSDGRFRFGPIDATMPEVLEAWESLMRG